MEKCLWSLDLLRYHTLCALRAEFQKYYLHFIWWFVEPIFELAVLYLVFGVFLASGQPDYVYFLLTGLILWQWFSNTVSHAQSSIYGSMRAFKHFGVHPAHFPLVVFFQDLFKYIPVVCTFLVVMAFIGPTPPSAVWLRIIPVMAVEGLCVLSCAMFFAALVPYLPDLSVLIPILLHSLFFASGIFFNIQDMVLPEHRLILYTNPNAVCISALRNILIDGVNPDWPLLAYAALVSLTVLAVSFLMISRSRSRYTRLINQ